MIVTLLTILGSTLVIFLSGVWLILFVSELQKRYKQEVN